MERHNENGASERARWQEKRINAQCYWHTAAINKAMRTWSRLRVACASLFLSYSRSPYIFDEIDRNRFAPNLKQFIIQILNAIHSKVQHIFADCFIFIFFCHELLLSACVMWVCEIGFFSLFCIGVDQELTIIGINMAQVKAGSYKHQKSPFNTLILTYFGYM